MRKYYGSIEDCKQYKNDSNHQAVVWKEFPFDFVVENTTEFPVEVHQKPSWLKKPAILNPGEKVTITSNNWGDGTVAVIKCDDDNVGCFFSISQGGMIERSYDQECDSDKLHIAPVFDDSVVKIVTCKNCGPNLGIVTAYNIVPIENPAKSITVRNGTLYDIILWVEDQIVAKIKSKETAEVGIYNSCLLRVDTAEEEILWESDGINKYKKILRVNGCCIEIINGKVESQHFIVGPEESEPYVRFLYETSSKLDENDPDLTIWCNTIDYRLD